jgi:multicomponent Na+:H+ antiporter subunit G
MVIFFLIAIALILLGLFFIISGIIGLIRFPDSMSKLHAAGVIDACGTPILLLGLCFIKMNLIFTIKICIIIALIMILSPLSSFAVANCVNLEESQ